MAKKIKDLPVDPNLTFQRLLFSADPTTGRLFQISFDQVRDLVLAPTKISINTNAVWNIPAGYKLDEIIINPATSLTGVTAGTVANGDDILAAVDISAGQYYTVRYTLPAPISTPIYFSNIIGNTNISVYLKKL